MLSMILLMSTKGVEKMKSIVKTAKGIGNIALEEREIPRIGDHEVLIKICGAAVCGTDLHIYHDQFPYWPPVILGHEFSGIIYSKGDKVTDWAIGDRVVGEPHTLSCGQCYYCRTGRIQNCASKRSPGWGIDGCFAQYMRYPEPRLLHRLPESISFELGSLVEPIANVITDVVERGDLRAGDTVVVIGPGPIGLMAGIVAKACGASKVVLVGTEVDQAYRIPLAQELGVFDTIVLGTSQDSSRILTDISQGLGVDLVIEASGSQGGISSGISLLRKYGTFVGIGLPGRDTIEFPYKLAMSKVLNIVCNMSTSYTSWERAISILDEQQDLFFKLISEVISLDDWSYGFEKLERREAMKIVFKP